MNDAYECGRNPIVRECGPAFYNALLDTTGSIFDSAAPGCKVTVKKAAGGAGMLTSSSIVLGIGLGSLRFI